MDWENRSTAKPCTRFQGGRPRVWNHELFATGRRVV